MVRRFIIRTRGYHEVDVVDLLTRKVIATFTHEWRAEKLVNELTSEARSNGEPIVAPGDLDIYTIGNTKEEN
jgi:hypothetical protein